MFRVDSKSDGFKTLPKLEKKVQNSPEGDILQKALSGNKNPQKSLDFENLKPVPMPVDTTKYQPFDNMPLPDYIPNEKKVLTPEEIEKLELL